MTIRNYHTLPRRSAREERDYLRRPTEDHRHLAEDASKAKSGMIHLRSYEIYRNRVDRLAMVLPD